MRNRNRLPTGIYPIRIRRGHGLPGYAGWIALHESPARIQQCAFAGEQIERTNKRENKNGEMTHEPNHAKTYSGGKRNVESSGWTSGSSFAELAPPSSASRSPAGRMRV